MGWNPEFSVIDDRLCKDGVMWWMEKDEDDLLASDSDHNSGYWDSDENLLSEEGLVYIL